MVLLASSPNSKETPNSKKNSIPFSVFICQAIRNRPLIFSLVASICRSTPRKMRPYPGLINPPIINIGPPTINWSSMESIRLRIIASRWYSTMAWATRWRRRSRLCSWWRRWRVMDSNVPKGCRCGPARVKGIRSHTDPSPTSNSTSSKMLKVKPRESRCRHLPIWSLTTTSRNSSFSSRRGNSSAWEVSRARSIGFWAPNSCKTTTQFTISKTRRLDWSNLWPVRLSSDQKMWNYKFVSIKSLHFAIFKER